MIDQYLRFRSQLAEALDPAFYPIEWLDQQILDGRAAPIATANACVVAEIRTYPGGAREVHGLVAAGDLAEIVAETIPAVEEMGREHGCRFACCESREGWVRMLKSSGYRVHQVTLRKEL